MKTRLFLPFAVIGGLLTVSGAARAQLLTPTPYLSVTDSPFASLPTVSGGYFFLEDVEDNLFNTPGVTFNGIVTSISFGLGTIVDSVDADDGAINGANGNAGVFGDSLFSNNSMTFDFNATTLGTLPSHVGIVWTDGSNNITFEVFDALGASFGTVTGSHADGNFNNGTAEDRFYGAINAGGISRITVSNPGGLELDHLQYGTLQNTVAVPEAGTLSLVGSALGMLGVCIARRRKTA
ncbi:MAG: hypothetical protein H7Y38_19115 [Armatimonadetes bacterium]|nr:hypothetical protein [Armatimonadota bacterium]